MLLYFAAAGQQYSGNTGYLLKQYSQENGMITTDAYLLLRDNRGFLWIGGERGLSRFDGRNFVNFTVKEGLGENGVNDLRVDTNGLIYIVSSAHISIYTRAVYHPFRTYNLSPQFTGIGSIYPVDSDYIYLADDSRQKMYLLHGKKIQKIEGFDGKPIQMQRDHKGILYVLTTVNQIFAIKGTRVINMAPEPPFVVPEGQIQLHRRLEKARNGSVYYNAIRLWKLDGDSRELVQDCQRYPCEDTHYNFSILPTLQGNLFVWDNGHWVQKMPFPNAITYGNTLLPEKNGSFWLTCNKGLFHYYPRAYITHPYEPILYYLTTDSGNRRIMRHDSQLYNNPEARRAYDLLKNRHLYTIYHQHNGTIWYCTNAGVYYLTGGHGPLRYYNLPHRSDEPGVVFAKAMEDRQGNMWFETYNGLFVYKDGQFRQWYEENGLQNIAIYASAIDKNGTFFAGADNIYALSKSKSDLLSIRMGTGREIIYAMDVDKHGNLWVCLNKNMLLKIGRNAQGTYVATDSLTLNINEKEFVPIAITFDSNDNVWLAGYGQMAIYFRQRDNRFNGNAKLVLGKSQQLTPLTDKGRLYLYTDARRQHIYLYQDSLVSDFDAQQVINTHPPEPPQIRLTDIQLAEKSIDWSAWGLAINADGLPVNPAFKSENNRISFHFTGITSYEPEAVVYQYMLQGQDEHWQPVTPTAEGNYTNLSPGNYIFYVRAADINGLWSAPVSFSFSILPPWYRTWWAYTLWALLTAGGIWSLFTLRVKVVKRRASMERLVVEHQLKALRAQINPHFLQNTFDFLSQTLDEQPLQRSQQVIRQLSAYMRNVLYRSDETVVTMEDELDFAEEYLAINQLLFNNRFHYEISIGDEVDTFGVKLPSMLLQPMLENAIKHGVRHTGDGSALIDIQVRADDHFVICIISNSIPVKAAVPYAEGYKPKGLQITLQRMTLLFRNSAYPPTIAVKTEEGFYRVIISIPL